MFSHNALSQFSSYTNAKILLPTGEASTSLDCAIRLDVPPFLEAEFLTGQLPVDEIDLQGLCIISCESSGTVYKINARIEEILNERCLRLEAFDVTNPPQKRRFFRIDAEVSMKYWQIDQDEAQPGKAIMKKVNLSGCGIRFSTDEALQLDQLVRMELSFPDPYSNCVEAAGRVVRVISNGDHHQEAALDLVEIDAAEQEKIIRFCLAEQRRQIRFRVQVQARA
ncbi:hypothetical protein DESUT3_36640 [Desulfuromonas versatilis]|uniref:PilZ domain-containing protein n=1 Tax=Desulfuromonas versatilis TaxID=2802975 RepID=A0ABN6E2L8_9BACT|nr:PilZ domain-containing protein [Desulfuromonas versatilis]BCR06595.1 hypothetical protein DESUT3_36640 [Desulfuromonas versatilis]